MNNNETISDDAMMRFIAAAFALNGILNASVNAPALPAPDAAAKMSTDYANALMKSLKKSKKQMQE
jgi:hypothetical protein